LGDERAAEAGRAVWRDQDRWKEKIKGCGMDKRAGRRRDQRGCERENGRVDESTCVGELVAWDQEATKEKYKYPWQEAMIIVTDSSAAQKWRLLGTCGDERRGRRKKIRIEAWEDEVN
jgi:hypothetical protein